MLRALKEDPNHIFIVCNQRKAAATSPPHSVNNMKLKLPSRRDRFSPPPRYPNGNSSGNNDSSLKSRVIAFATIGITILIFIHTMSPGGKNDTGILSSTSSIAGRLRLSSKKELSTNRFSFSTIHSPYEQIWVNSRLPGWAKKKKQFRDIEEKIPPSERICFVHVGKAGGSSVGCSLGFSLHCDNTTQPSLNGLLPRRTTRMFHADTYDCYDDSAYFLFVVRNPVERIRSAFLYERPTSEEDLKKNFPQEYERRKNLYLDCPSFGVMENFVQDGMTKDGKASEVCKFRAFSSVRGDLHFTCHMYFNYQFHLEGIPKDANILTIRNEHLIQDWNGVEHFIGGVKEIIPPEIANETIPVLNKSKKSERDKWLSEESTYIMCRNLCNEIVSYKKILRRALNLNSQDVELSIEELRVTCPEYADYEEGDCPVPMPNVTEKMIDSRGYTNFVIEGSS